MEDSEGYSAVLQPRQRGAAGVGAGVGVGSAVRHDCKVQANHLVRLDQRRREWVLLDSLACLRLDPGFADDPRVVWQLAIHLKSRVDAALDQLSRRKLTEMILGKDLMRLQANSERRREPNPRHMSRGFQRT